MSKDPELLYALPVDQVRALEACALQGLKRPGEFGSGELGSGELGLGELGFGQLMEHAAAGLAAVVVRHLVARAGRLYGTRVLLLVGSGDNGGDTLLAGARLARRGVAVTAVQLGSAVHSVGATALAAAGGRWVPLAQVDRALASADLVLDGIVGIGSSGALRPTAADVVSAIPPTALVVAVDLPSGVDADTGDVPGTAVRADVTVCFGVLKPGLLVDPGARHAGIVELVDIGLPDVSPSGVVEVLTVRGAAARFPVPGANSDKYRRGVVGVLAGSGQYPGAAVLATTAASRAGAGMVRFAGPAAAADGVRAARPEVLVTALGGSRADEVLNIGRVQAWVAGPGIGSEPVASGWVQRLLDTPEPLLLDADGIAAAGKAGLARRGAVGLPTLLTPHAGELARLLGLRRDAVEASPLRHARQAAAELGVHVLLKGSATIVAAPDGTVRANRTGTSWLATAGSGDVLAGVCGTLLAAGLGCLDAGSLGAWLHGLAARLASGGVPPHDAVRGPRLDITGPGAPVVGMAVADALPAAVRWLLAEGSR